MTDLFYTVLSMSGYGLVAALAAALIITLFSRTRCSKTALLLLWAVAAFRLLCPWSPPSAVSLFNWTSMDRYASQAADTMDHIYTGDAQRAVNAENWSREDYERVVSAGVEPVQNPSTGLWEVHYYENNTGSITPAKTLRESCGSVLSVVWLTGAAGFLLYGAVSYLLLKRRLRFAVKDENLSGIWYSDRIASPCVAGLFRPKIYLTFGMSEEETAYVLAHERQHIKNGDHLWKLLGWLVMSVHWFNPLLWLCYGVFLWTLEDACDQRVLRQLGEDKKADYGQALLALSTGRRFRLSPSPIAFSEGDAKGRVKRILKYKKPLAWLTAFALLLAAVVSLCVLTSADNSEVPAGDDGAYQVSGLIHQTSLSSLSWYGFLDQCRGTQVIYTPERFYLEMEDLDVAHPIYEEMELGVDLLFMDTGNDDFDRTMNIELPEGAKGFKVLTSGGEETGYHVLEVEGRIWVGKWVTHGTASKMSEYWYIVEASLTSAAGTAYGALSDGLVCWSLDPYLSSVFPGFPFVFDVENGTRLEASCDSGSLYIYDEGAYQDQGSQVSLPDTRAIYWHPYSSDGENTDQADLTFSIYQNDRLLLSGTILIRPDVADPGDDLRTYIARASLSDPEAYFFLRDPGTGGGLITSQSPESPNFPFTFTAAIVEILDNALLVEPMEPIQDGAERILVPVEDGIWNQLLGDLVDITARGSITSGSPAILDEVLDISLAAQPLTSWQADLTHNGENETISVFADDSSTGRYFITVSDASGNILWTDEAYNDEAGKNGIYLCSQDGQFYLLVWRPSAKMGWCNADYRVFCLSSQGKELILAENSINFWADDAMRVDVGAIRTFEAEIIPYLSHSDVLLSTNGDTPLDNSSYRIYSTPDDPMSPILEDSIWGGYPTADDFEALQALAEGTYTFTAEVISAGDGRLLVAATELPTYPRFILPREGEARRMWIGKGETIRVTADGPLYFSDLPDEGTTVTVEKLS